MIPEPVKEHKFETCAFCRRRFEITKHDNSRYLPDGRAVCAGCFEDMPENLK